MLDAWGRIGQRVACWSVIFAGLALGAAVGVSDASAQGLFEALFGRRVLQEPPPVVVISPGHLRGQQVRPRKPQAHSHRTAAPAKPEPYVAPEVMPGPLGRFLKDPTLKRGDVVATVDGLMVFRANSGSKHRAKDFVPLAKAAQFLPKKMRTDLARMDHVVRTGDALLSSSSQLAAAAPPIVAQDEKVAIR